MVGPIRVDLSRNELVPFWWSMMCAGFQVCASVRWGERRTWPILRQFSAATSVRLITAER